MMTTSALQKNYKKLENRLEAVEIMLKAAMQDELSPAKIGQLERLSKKIDTGAGRRMSSPRAFSQYIKLL